MGKAVRFGLAAAALMSASPALASDFSGVGRAMLWAVGAIIVLIMLLVTLLRRWRKPGDPAVDGILSVLAAVMLAPVGLMEMDGRWLPMPLPGTALAMIEGDLAVLFPVPMISMVLCGFGLLRLFKWLRSRHGERGEVGN
jgi:hypothetical protein